MKKTASEPVYSKTVLNVLVAFPYFKSAITNIFKGEAKDTYRLIVDSGAFTAHRSGKPISLDAYCKFLDSIESLRPFNAVQLDVIGDHEATFKNYETMRSRGYDVIPVFTRGSPLSMLDEMYKTSDYALVGGVAFGEQRRNYVKFLMPHLQGKKYHLLGFTDMDFIKTHKPYSVDSSGWVAGGRYGRLYLYKGFGKFDVVGREMFFPILRPEMETAFRRMGLTQKETALLLKESSWRGGNNIPGFNEKGAVRMVGGYSHILMSNDLERYIGTKFFLAVTTYDELSMLFYCRALIEERKKEGLL